MTVTINCDPENFPEKMLSVSDIMKRKNYTFQHIITRLNGALVHREQRDITMVSDGDDLEIYHLISGG